MGDLADFLAARIYDDEQLARELPAPDRWEARHWGIEPGPDSGGYVIDASLETGEAVGQFDDLRHALFVAQWDPARVLLECEAKRGILLDYMTQLRRYNADTRDGTTRGTQFMPRPSDLPLRYLALPYRAHPEYSEAWAPPAAGTVETWGRRW
jgi:hypothetical protein